MALPVTDKQLSIALADLMGSAASIKTATTTLRDESIAGNVPRKRFIDFMARLDRTAALVSSYSSVLGLLQYARDQYGNQTLDIVADFVAYRNAALALRDWISSVFPKDAGTGAWLVSEFQNDGTEVLLEFTPAQLSGFVTNCDTLLATMD